MHFARPFSREEPLTFIGGSYFASGAGPAWNIFASAALLEIYRLRVIPVPIQDLSDESVLKLYENIREQVSADMNVGGKHRLLGETARQQAQRLRDELDRRRLKFTPIDWR